MFGKKTEIRQPEVVLSDITVSIDAWGERHCDTLEEAKAVRRECWLRGQLSSISVGLAFTDEDRAEYEACKKAFFDEIDAMNASAREARNRQAALTRKRNQAAKK